MVCDLEVPPISPPSRTLCPASPSLQWVPWASVPHLHRYYAPLRLPTAHLEVLRSSLVPRYPGLHRLVRVPLPARRWARHKTLPTPGPLFSRWPIPSGISGGRQSALPSSRVAPMSTCPALRPRWCPKDFAITPPRLLPSGINKPSAFPLWLPRAVIPMTTTTLFRGSITRPAPSLHPASHGRTWTESGPHPLGNNSEFHELSPNPNASGFAWRESISVSNLYLLVSRLNYLKHLRLSKKPPDSALSGPISYTSRLSTIEVL
jgi:hypothetical protein